MTALNERTEGPAVGRVMANITMIQSIIKARNMDGNKDCWNLILADLMDEVAKMLPVAARELRQ